MRMREGAMLFGRARFFVALRRPLLVVLSVQQLDRTAASRVAMDFCLNWHEAGLETKLKIAGISTSFTNRSVAGARL